MIMWIFNLFVDYFGMSISTDVLNLRCHNFLYAFICSNIHSPP